MLLSRTRNTPSLPSEITQVEPNRQHDEILNYSGFIHLFVGVAQHFRVAPSHGTNTNRRRPLCDSFFVTIGHQIIRKIFPKTKSKTPNQMCEKCKCAMRLPNISKIALKTVTKMIKRIWLINRIDGQCSSKHKQRVIIAQKYFVRIPVVLFAVAQHWIQNKRINVGRRRFCSSDSSISIILFSLEEHHQCTMYIDSGKKEMDETMQFICENGDWRLAHAHADSSRVRLYITSAQPQEWQ